MGNICLPDGYQGKTPDMLFDCLLHNEAMDVIDDKDWYYEWKRLGLDKGLKQKQKIENDFDADGGNKVVWITDVIPSENDIKVVQQMYQIRHFGFFDGKLYRIYSS